MINSLKRLLSLGLVFSFTAYSNDGVIYKPFQTQGSVDDFAVFLTSIQKACKSKESIIPGPNFKCSNSKQSILELKKITGSNQTKLKKAMSSFFKEIPDDIRPDLLRQCLLNGGTTFPVECIKKLFDSHEVNHEAIERLSQLVSMYEAQGAIASAACLQVQNIITFPNGSTVPKQNGQDPSCEAQSAFQILNVMRPKEIAYAPSKEALNDKVLSADGVAKKGSTVENPIKAPLASEKNSGRGESIDVHWEKGINDKAPLTPLFGKTQNDPRYLLQCPLPLVKDGKEISASNDTVTIKKVQESLSRFHAKEQIQGLSVLGVRPDLRAGIISVLREIPKRCDDSAIMAHAQAAISGLEKFEDELAMPEHEEVAQRLRDFDHKSARLMKDFFDPAQGSKISSVFENSYLQGICMVLPCSTILRGLSSVDHLMDELKIERDFKGECAVEYPLGFPKVAVSKNVKNPLEKRKFSCDESSTLQELSVLQSCEAKYQCVFELQAKKNALLAVHQEFSELVGDKPLYMSKRPEDYKKGVSQMFKEMKGKHGVLAYIENLCENPEEMTRATINNPGELNYALSCGKNALAPLPIDLNNDPAQKISELGEECKFIRRNANSLCGLVARATYNENISKMYSPFLNLSKAAALEIGMAGLEVVSAVSLSAGLGSKFAKEAWKVGATEGLMSALTKGSYRGLKSASEAFWLTAKKEAQILIATPKLGIQKLSGKKLLSKELEVFREGAKTGSIFLGFTTFAGLSSVTAIKESGKNLEKIRAACLRGDGESCEKLSDATKLRDETARNGLWKTIQYSLLGLIVPGHIKEFNTKIPPKKLDALRSKNKLYVASEKAYNEAIQEFQIASRRFDATKSEEATTALAQALANYEARALEHFNQGKSLRQQYLEAAGIKGSDADDITVTDVSQATKYLGENELFNIAQKVFGRDALSAREAATLVDVSHFRGKSSSEEFLIKLKNDLELNSDLPAWAQGLDEKTPLNFHERAWINAIDERKGQDPLAWLASELSGGVNSKKAQKALQRLQQGQYKDKAQRVNDLRIVFEDMDQNPISTQLMGLLEKTKKLISDLGKKLTGTLKTVEVRANKDGELEVIYSSKTNEHFVTILSRTEVERYQKTYPELYSRLSADEANYVTGIINILTKEPHRLYFMKGKSLQEKIFKYISDIICECEGSSCKVK